MTKCQTLTPDRDSDKSQLEQVQTQRKSGKDRGCAPSGSVTLDDIGSPYRSTDTQQSYESVDFGESGEELI